MSKTLNILFILFIVTFGVIYKDVVKNVWLQSVNRYFPCKVAISYDIGTFDTRFGLSRADFLSVLAQAEAIWEKPLGKELFTYSEGGSLKVNLIYDERQETTEQLQDLGEIVDSNKESYDSLKARYDKLMSDYRSSKNAFEARVAAFETRRKAYDAEVAAVNKKGGGNKATVDRLNKERDYLNTESRALSAEQSELNATVSYINSVATALNELAKTLNIGVQKYNNIGDNLGAEFDEGVYRSDATGREIDIYQFEDKTKLVRVLAHEMGHALGLDHVEDTKAIMYRLNNGINEKLTSTDLADLKKLCRIE